MNRIVITLCEFCGRVTPCFVSNWRGEEPAICVGCANLAVRNLNKAAEEVIRKMCDGG